MNPILLGNILGVPVLVTGSALFVLAYMILGSRPSSPAELATSALYALMFFFSILVHELGHAVTGRRLGLMPRQIVLHGFGGLCEYGRSPRAKEGFYTAAAGPIAGLALGVVTFLILLVIDGRVPQPVPWLFDNLLRLTVFWSLFNLLPMWPLDGGHVLWHGLRQRLPGGRAWSITRAIGIGTALLVAGVAWAMPWVFGIFGMGSIFPIIIAAMSLLHLIQRD